MLTFDHSPLENIGTKKVNCAYRAGGNIPADKISLVDGMFGGKCLYAKPGTAWNGNNLYSYISTDNIDGILPSKAPFTIEYWVNLKDYVTGSASDSPDKSWAENEDIVVGFLLHGAKREGHFMSLSSNLENGQKCISYQRFYSTETSTYVTDVWAKDGAYKLSLNTWHHIAITFDTDNITVFIDGKKINTTKNYLYACGDSRIFYVDIQRTNDSNVYVDNVILSDVIRYTNNFDPYTAWFMPRLQYASDQGIKDYLLKEDNSGNCFQVIDENAHSWWCPKDAIKYHQD